MYVSSSHTTHLQNNCIYVSKHLISIAQKFIYEIYIYLYILFYDINLYFVWNQCNRHWQKQRLTKAALGEMWKPLKQTKLLQKWEKPSHQCCNSTY